LYLKKDSSFIGSIINSVGGKNQHYFMFNIKETQTKDF
jgi:hypothetical protein